MGLRSGVRELTVSPPGYIPPSRPGIACPGSSGGSPKGGERCRQVHQMILGGGGTGGIRVLAMTDLIRETWKEGWVHMVCGSLSRTETRLRTFSMGKGPMNRGRACRIRCGGAGLWWITIPSVQKRKLGQQNGDGWRGVGTVWRP